MIKKILFAFFLFVIGMGLLVYNRIHFDAPSDMYSDIMDFQLGGLTMGFLLILYLSFNRSKKRLINSTIIFLGILIVSVVILGIAAQYRLDAYQELELF